MIYLYTDGSSTGRSNREWGWGWVLVEDDMEIMSGSGGGPSGTNNIAELTAAVEGLSYVEASPEFKGAKLTLICDSQYVLKTASGEYTPKKNKDLCEELGILYFITGVELQWVKGHSGNKWNEYADKLSKQGKALYALNKNK